jgi:hypothetical protein
MTLVEPAAFAWLRARKTKPIRAKLLRDVLRADEVIHKFMLQTLEGHQAVRDVPGTMICIGAAADFDVWQQERKKLFAKYNITDIDDNGWLLCEPKPDAEVDCYEVLATEPFEIRALFGTTQPDGSFRQTGQPGDFVCRSRSDPNDMWIVARRVFFNTYEVTG